MVDMITFFGVRHLSPASAYHMYKELEKIKPDIVLIEGPSNINDEIKWFAHKQTKMPAAILAYTNEAPIKTILYPLAQYSPEYQAIIWSYKNKVKCKFMDLPSDVFLALRKNEQNENNQSEQDETEKNFSPSVYEQLENFLGQSHEAFWERNFEQIENDFISASNEFGKQIRLSENYSDIYNAENCIREGFMKRVICQCEKEGFKNIFCVCGSYHVEGIKQINPMTDEQLEALPKVLSNITLMPYSYYRLSSHSGYGAGNNAPAYFELLWNAIKSGNIENASYEYLANIANEQRKQGHMVSAAEVIEAVRLSKSLAQIRQSKYPVLDDLRDAAITCMGHGNFSEISVSVASTEIGIKIGSLPEGVSRTSIQDDFYRNLKDLKLERYLSPKAQTLELDIRENLRVKSERSAFLDLNRSVLLHRLRVIGVRFGEIIKNKSAWTENWALCWSPEAEIEIVEAALLGETISLAAAFKMKETAENAQSISEAAVVFEDAFLCKIERAAEHALDKIQSLAVDSAAIEEISKTAQSLSNAIRYGDLRQMSTDMIVPLLSKIYLRACLILENSCICDDSASKIVMQSMEILNRVQIDNDFLDENMWIDLINRIASRDDINTKCSGFAMATLIERGLIDEKFIAVEVSRRLSKGMPAELGAGWFEGLAQKNRYSIIMRISLWRELDNYISSLDDDEFKRALVFLRRAFADFLPNEKSDISENLGEIWNIQPEQVCNVIMSKNDDILQGLDDFNFDDI